MRNTLAIAMGLLVACAPSAHADWEWTHWGMTSSQALSASQGKAVFATATERQRRMYRRGFTPIQVPHLVAEHRAGDVDFLAYLLFDTTSAKLVCVDMVPKPGAALNPSVKNALTDTYGAPAQEETKQLPGIQWTVTTWVGDKDVIELQQGGLGAKLKYCQRDKGSRPS